MLDPRTARICKMKHQRHHGGINHVGDVGKRVFVILARASYYTKIRHPVIPLIHPVIASATPHSPVMIAAPIAHGPLPVRARIPARIAEVVTRMLNVHASIFNTGHINRAHKIPQRRSKISPTPIAAMPKPNSHGVAGLGGAHFAMPTSTAPDTRFSKARISKMMQPIPGVPVPVVVVGTHTPLALRVIPGGQGHVGTITVVATVSLPLPCLHGVGCFTFAVTTKDPAAA